VLRAEVASLKGHTALITSIIFSSDKSTLASCSKDGKIAFWNARDKFKLLSMFKYSEQEDELN
jgi:WD40 repeat protein